MFIFLLSTSVLLLMYIFFKMQTAYQSFGIMGVSFKPEQARHRRTLALQKSCQRKLLLIFLAAVLLQALFLLPPLRPYLLLSMILLMLLQLMFSLWISERFFRQLKALKQEQGWGEAMKAKAAADLAVSRERGKSAPSVLWIWLLCLLAFVPLPLLALSQTFETGGLLTFALVPLTLLILPLIYPSICQAGQTAVSDSSEINKIYARRSERIAGESFLLLTAFSVGFWIAGALMFLYLPYKQMTIWGIVLLFLFILMIPAVFFRAKRKRRRLEEALFDKAEWQVNSREQYYKGGFYYNKDDSRLLVPKQVPSMGSTLNMARPAAKVIMGITLLFVAALLLFIAVMLTAQFKFRFQDDTFRADIPFYGIELRADEIESIELSEEPIKASRVNGYAGSDRRYGQWSMKPYGPIRLYVYNDCQLHIILKLKDGSRVKAVILNEENRDASEKLFAELKQWHSKQKAALPQS